MRKEARVALVRTCSGERRGRRGKKKREKHPDGLAKGQGEGGGGGVEADTLPTERINKALVTLLIITART